MQTLNFLILQSSISDKSICQNLYSLKQLEMISYSSFYCKIHPKKGLPLFLALGLPFVNQSLIEDYNSISFYHTFSFWKTCHLFIDSQSTLKNAQMSSFLIICVQSSRIFIKELYSISLCKIINFCASCFFSGAFLSFVLSFLFFFLNF